MKTNLAKPAAGVQPLLNLNLRFFVFPGLLLLVFFPPFFRGLFFAPDLLLTHLYTAVLFALGWWDKLIRRDSRFVGSSFDYLMGLYILVYLLSLIGALDMRGAVGEVLKVINYVMVYWITAQLIRTEKDIRRILTAIYLSAVGVALVGIAAAAGSFNYPGAMVDNRIYSTLQYPNALAAFLTAALIIGLVLLVRADKALPKLFYSLGNLPLMVVILASQSRGSWFMFPVVMALLIVGITRRYRFETAVNMVITLGISLQAYRLMLPGINSQEGMTVVKPLLFGALGVLAVQAVYLWVIRYLDAKQVTFRTKKLLAAGVVVYAGMVFLFYAAYSAQVLPSVTAKFVPSSVMQRAQTIDNTDSSFQYRLDFTKAAFKIALDYPFNGTGGEGWEAVYHRYMPYLLWTTEVHNNFGKVLVETGFPGLAVLLAIWIWFVRRLALLWRNGLEDEPWALIWGAGVAALALGIHSAYDFDLSIPALSIILFALFGTVEGASRIYLPKGVKERTLTLRTTGIAFLAGTLGAALLFIPSYRLYAAGVTGAEGARAIKEKNLAKAEAKFLEARSLDSFTASYPADLAHVYTLQGLLEKQPAKLEQANHLAEEAIKKEPHNLKLRSKLILLYLTQQRNDLAVREAEALVAINPLLTPNYEVLGQVYIGAGKQLADQGQLEKARVLWEKATAIPGLIEDKQAGLTSKPAYPQEAPLQATPAVMLAAGEAHYLLGNKEEARTIFTSLKDDPEIKKEAELYLKALK